MLSTKLSEAIKNQEISNEDKCDAAIKLSMKLHAYEESKDAYLKEQITEYADRDNKYTFAGTAYVCANAINGTDKYNNKAVAVYEDLLKNISSTDTTDLCTAVKTMPFYMMAETKLGKKEHYNDITVRFKALTDKISKEFTADEAARYLVTVINVMEYMSQELFEHYMALADMFKNMLKASKDKLLSADATTKMYAAYAVNRACDMRVILTEKYEALAEELLA